jgi:hypothetical protein
LSRRREEAVRLAVLEERGLSPEHLSVMPESDRVEWLRMPASFATGAWEGPLRGHAHLNFSPDGRRLVAYEQAGVDLEASRATGREQSMASWSYVAERGPGWTSGPRPMRQAFEVPERATAEFEAVFPIGTVNTSERLCPRYFFKRARFCWSSDVFVVTVRTWRRQARTLRGAGRRLRW